MKRCLFVLTLTVYVASSVFFLLCVDALAQTKPVVIGCVGDFTGTYSTIAVDQKAGADMAIDEINAAGGVLGRKLSAVYEDSGSKPAMAATKTEELILKDNANFVMGDISSGATLAMMKIAEKHRVPMVAPIAESVKITTDEKSKYVFRLPAHVIMTNIALAKAMIEKAGPRLYLLSVDYDWGHTVSEAYREGAKKYGGIIVGETLFPLDTKDFAPYFGKIKAARPDALLITSAGNDALAVLSQLNQYGLDKADEDRRSGVDGGRFQPCCPREQRRRLYDRRLLRGVPGESRQQEVPRGLSTPFWRAAEQIQRHVLRSRQMARPGDRSGQHRG